MLVPYDTNTVNRAEACCLVRPVIGDAAKVELQRVAVARRLLDREG
jgi:hypothetical protein